MSERPGDEDFMRLAIEEARRGDEPFGAVIVNAAGEVVARGANAIRSDRDPTAHGEVQAIRDLTRGREDGQAEPGLTLYTTCDPCPMCSAAIMWAGIEALVIGAEIADIKRLGWRTIEMPCEEIYARAPQRIEIRRGVLREECVALYELGR